MFIDALCLVSDAQAFTTDAASTYSIDLGNVTPKRDVGIGEPLAAAIGFDVAASPSSGSYEFRIIQSDTSDLATPDVLVAIFPTSLQMTTTCVLYIPIPGNLITKRYIGAYFNNVSGTTTVTATIAIGPQSFIQAWRPYAKGYTIS